MALSEPARSKKRILVTGFGGIIGQHVVKAALNAGHEVYAQYRTYLPPVSEYTNKPFTLIQADLIGSVDLPPDIDILVHAAATSPQTGVSDEKITRDNVEGARAVSNWAHHTRIPKIIYLSSLSVYASPEGPAVDEMNLPDATNAYGRSKIFGERTLETTCSDSNILSLRLPGVVGLGGSRAWLAGTARKLIRKERVDIYNPDSLFNNVLLADELADFILSTSSRDMPKADVLTLAALQPIPLHEVVAVMAEVANVKPDIHVIEAPNPSYHISTLKAEAQYAFCPSTTVEAARRLMQIFLSAPLSKI